MIVYLHGFGSTGNNSKVNVLAEYLGTNVYSPTYPSNDIDTAIDIVSNLIETYRKENEPLMVIGSSMGGFIANYIGRKYGAKIVLINPALSVANTLADFIGKNKNFYTGAVYNLTAEHIAEFDKYKTASPVNGNGTLVLLNAGDEVIDYTDAVKFYKGNADVRVFEGGDHKFSNMHDALPIIKDYLNSVWL